MGDQPRPTATQHPPASRYDFASALLHWLLVFAVLAQLGLGWTLHYWPHALPYRQPAAWVHVSLGISIALLVLVSLFWRLIFAAPKMPASAPSWFGSTGRPAAMILYFLLILMPLTGYLGLVFAGKAVHFWTLPLPPWAWKDADLSALYMRWHFWAAVVLSAVAVLHILLVVGAALRHPGLLSRMRPAFSRRVVLPTGSDIRVQEGSDVGAKEGAEWKGATAESRRLARHLRVFGWIAFWGQLCLGLIAVLLLIVTASSKYYSSGLLKIPYGLSWLEGVSWANLAIALLSLTVIGFYYCTRIARTLKSGADPHRYQRRVTRLISGINFGSSLGVSIAILGTAFSIALLIAKTVSQPPGIAITDPQKIVRAVDVFVLLANFNIVVAHFIGILTCLWMLNRVHRFYSALEIGRATAGDREQPVPAVPKPAAPGLGLSRGGEGAVSA
ncbi:MAG: DUF3611 family protein [Chromatiaceae bacterium]